LRKDEQSDSDATFSHFGFPKGKGPLAHFFRHFLGRAKKWQITSAAALWRRRERES